MYEAGTGAMVAGGVIVLLGGWLGCCLIPCCLDECKDALHHCSHCGQLIGRKRFMFND